MSISLSEGEIFGFIGPNGAGNSTPIRSIMNLINKAEKYRIDLNRTHITLFFNGGQPL